MRVAAKVAPMKIMNILKTSEALKRLKESHWSKNGLLLAIIIWQMEKHENYPQLKIDIAL